jgi:hypothetical protein
MSPDPEADVAGADADEAESASCCFLFINSICSGERPDKSKEKEGDVAAADADEEEPPGPWEVSIFNL